VALIWNSGSAFSAFVDITQLKFLLRDLSEFVVVDVMEARDRTLDA